MNERLPTTGPAGGPGATDAGPEGTLRERDGSADRGTGSQDSPGGRRRYRGTSVQLARAHITTAARGALLEALSRPGDFEGGPERENLEAIIARHFGLPGEHVIATRSCTAAIHAAAKFLEEAWTGLTVPCLTYPGTYSWRSGVRLLDCDETGWPFETPGISVDLWGRRAPRTGLIIDAAHRFLAPEHPDLLHTAAEFICYSFAPQKEVPAFMGGALVCRQRRYANVLRRRLRNNRGSPGPSWGSRDLLPEPVAAFVNAQLRHRVIWYDQRQLVLEHYYEALRVGSFPGRIMTLPEVASGHLMVVRMPTARSAELVRYALTCEGIEHGLHFPVPEQHRRAHVLTQRLISLPCHTFLDADIVRRICGVVLEAAG